MNNLPGGVPDYQQFMKMTPGQRKNLLRVLGWMGGKQIQSLLMVVFEQDPDPEIRQMAREMLEKQGVQIRVEGAEGLEDVRRREEPSPLDNPVQNRPSIGVPVTDDLSRRAAEALRRGQGTPQAAPVDVSRESLAGSGATVYYTNAAGTFESPFSGPDTIDGGTGRPVARNQAFPQVFILHKGNDKYLRGETEKPAGTSLITFIIIFAVIAIIGTTLFTTVSFNGNAFWFFGIFALVIGLIVVSTISEMRKNQRLAAEGVLLVGQATNISGRWVSSGSGSSRSRSYKVTVNSRVKLPDGRMLNAVGTATRGDLRRAVLPNAGTPVAVLYIDDNTYKVL